MVDTIKEQDRPFRILHVLRAPLGGLFRHVLDLAREQIARGHAVGLITDSLTGGASADTALDNLLPSLQLGLSRIPIRRNPHLSDIPALFHVANRIRQVRPDIVHGHGSKGGLLARVPGFLSGTASPGRVYTPHGGSLNHRPGTRTHEVYMRVEAALQRRTDLILFESGFIATRYGAYVGRLPRFNRVVHNGIGTTEFEPIVANDDATDFLYVGELRSAKGIDTLLEAVARAGRTLGQVPSLTLVGSGPDRSRLELQAEALGLGDRIVFRSPLPVREAFALGRILVVPSRAESLPYVVLEAAGACIPMIATNVGGIPEIFGPFRDRLISADSVPDLSDRLIDTLLMSAARKAEDAGALADYVNHHFSIAHMVDGVLSGYRDALAAKVPARRVETRATVALSS